MWIPLKWYFVLPMTLESMISNRWKDTGTRCSTVFDLFCNVIVLTTLFMLMDVKRTCPFCQTVAGSIVNVSYEAFGLIFILTRTLWSWSVILPKVHYSLCRMLSLLMFLPQTTKVIEARNTFVWKCSLLWYWGIRNIFWIHSDITLLWLLLLLKEQILAEIKGKRV